MTKHVTIAATLLALVLCVCTSSAWAADEVRGSVGIGVGSSTTAYGLSGKLYLDPAFAVQGVVGIRNDSIGLSVDALYEMPALFRNEALEIAWNVGFGPGVYITDDTLGAAVAFVAGLEFNFLFIPSLPFDLVLEYRPSLFVLPGVDLDLVDFTGHIRVYF